MEASEFRRLRRGTLDLTQEGLAAALGLTARTVCNYEQGVQPIPAQTALAMECLVLRKMTPPRL